MTMIRERIDLGYIPAPTIAGPTFGEIKRFMTLEEMQAQAARCPGCGAPSCQEGCPIGRSIGDFHALIARGDFKGAADLRFNETSILAPLLGSVCPQDDNGLCEDPNNCVAGRGDGQSVMIADIEASLGWVALEEDWIKSLAPMAHVKEKLKAVEILALNNEGAEWAKQIALQIGLEVELPEDFENNPSLKVTGDYKKLNQFEDAMNKAKRVLMSHGEVGHDVKTTRIRQSVGIIGSGPAALSAAEEAVKMGYSVTIYEKEPIIGGLLTIGIPNFKLNQQLVGGILAKFHDNPYVDIVTNCEVGKHISLDEMASKHDVLIDSNGAQLGKSQEHVPVHHTPGVYQAMRDYLRPQSLENWGLNFPGRNMHGKDVVVIGLGYTGVDCFNTAYYQGAKSIRVLSGRAPDPNSNMEKNRKNGFNQYMLNEIRRGEKRGVRFEYGLEIAGYRYDEKHSKAVLTVKENGNEREIVADAIILSRGFNIHHIIKPENTQWASDPGYTRVQGMVTQVNGKPALIVGDAALKPEDRLVVKAAAQAVNSFRKHHFSLYPEDNLKQAFVGGRVRRFNPGRVISMTVSG